MQTHTTIMRNGKKELPDSETSINTLDLALKEKFPHRPAMLEELNKVLVKKG
ncbi:hypothetical protein QNI16_01855 [Cytophagaceae bacterium YF14B1]|uniref:Uncharacterized protein n=1 Tax=Xanthocytophaga flava TaxID=3048013 RepID=A0AAE3U6L2_9BACT|nr:hypothetical protein [Xanthocytophaga flavus]MDJ1479208.1 hypothetical protein [Xanthocytophaga flavus]